MAMGVLFASHTFSTCQDNKSDRKNLKQFHFFSKKFIYSILVYRLVVSFG
jgi:hypothetical protein